MTDAAAPLSLVPAPQRLRRLPGECRLPAGAELALRSPHGAAPLLRTGAALARLLAAAGMPVALTAQDRPEAAAEVEIVPELFARPQSYRLELRPGRLRLSAADAAGAWYGAMTLRQICRQLSAGAPLPCLAIEDWPDFPHRGVMLDISRDKVPTLATLKQLIARLSELKLNQFQLYTEHTFAYRNHRLVWRDASPLTAAEILELDDWCRERHVELVPNQNSFGHLERWLKHAPYLPLAEAPAGAELPWGGRVNYPTGLAPEDPRALELLRELYDELLPNFRSRQFNVGCDETFDLGQGRSAAACQARGKGRVYLEFLLKIHAEVRRRGRVMQFWGDIILHHPELIPELPGDIIPLVWGYEADHPFAEQCAKFADSGLGFYVCPGTSTWNAVAGRTANALANLRAAAEHGLATGAIGYLNTDWGDNGHWQPHAVSLLPYAYGAAVAWNLAGNRDEAEIAPAAGLHLFGNPELGRIAADLGNVYRGLGPRTSNCSVLFTLLQGAADDALFAGPPTGALTAAALARRGAEIATLDGRLAGLRSLAADGELLVAELRQAAAMLCFACDLGAARLRQPDRRLAAVPAGERAALKERLAGLAALHRQRWLARNRPGGLEESAARLERHLAGF
ncbi:MAG: glycoside hydrolase family 20 zincin-like fold domain-containing protein [Lentisphaeria bacterium]|jgi:hypothetical protein